MSKFDEVTQKLGKTPYMTEDRAKHMRSLMEEIRAEHVLELGCYMGKSTAYMAAVLVDNGAGEGHVTTIDRPHAKKLSPNIDANLATVGLTDWVTPIYAQRSYTWELAKMIQENPRPQFDFCYLDGGHTWDMTGFGFVLIDMLLRPGGVIVLDDLDWTISGTIKSHPERAKTFESYTQDEKNAKGVRLVWDTIVPHLGYQRQEAWQFHWGIARKPVHR